MCEFWWPQLWFNHPLLGPKLKFSGCNTGALLRPTPSHISLPPLGRVKNVVVSALASREASRSSAYTATKSPEFAVRCLPGHQTTPPRHRPHLSWIKDFGTSGAPKNLAVMHLREPSCNWYNIKSKTSVSDQWDRPAESDMPLDVLGPPDVKPPLPIFQGSQSRRIIRLSWLEKPFLQESRRKWLQMSCVHSELNNVMASVRGSARSYPLWYFMVRKPS